MVMPTATLAYEYAYEARGYGPLLGFVALAILCWQQLELLQMADDRHPGNGGCTAQCSLVSLLCGLAFAGDRHGRDSPLPSPQSMEPMVWLALCAPIILLVALFPVIDLPAYSPRHFGRKLA